MSQAAHRGVVCTTHLPAPLIQARVIGFVEMRMSGNGEVKEISSGMKWIRVLMSFREIGIVLLIFSVHYSANP
jgi:hypothetical protein